MTYFVFGARVRDDWRFPPPSPASGVLVRRRPVGPVPPPAPHRREAALVAARHGPPRRSEGGHAVEQEGDRSLCLDGFGGGLGGKERGSCDESLWAACTLESIPPSSRSSPFEHSSHTLLPQRSEPQRSHRGARSGARTGDDRVAARRQRVHLVLLAPETLLEERRGRVSLCSTSPGSLSGGRCRDDGCQDAPARLARPRATATRGGRTLRAEMETHCVAKDAAAPIHRRSHPPSHAHLVPTPNHPVLGSTPSIRRKRTSLGPPRGAARAARSCWAFRARRATSASRWRRISSLKFANRVTKPLMSSWPSSPNESATVRKSALRAFTRSRTCASCRCASCANERATEGNRSPSSPLAKFACCDEKSRRWGDRRSKGRERTQSDSANLRAGVGRRASGFGSSYLGLKHSDSLIQAAEFGLELPHVDLFRRIRRDESLRGYGTTGERGRRRSPPQVGPTSLHFSLPTAPIKPLLAPSSRVPHSSPQGDRPRLAVKGFAPCRPD